MTSSQSSDLSFEGRLVRVAGRTWEVAYDIADCQLVDGRVVVLFNDMAGPRHRQFRNLEAFDLDGRRLWTAEHPTSDTAASYVEFVDGPPLTVWNFACYVCRIDPESGRLVEKRFTK